MTCRLGLVEMTSRESSVKRSCATTGADPAGIVQKKVTIIGIHRRRIAMARFLSSPLGDAVVLRCKNRICSERAGRLQAPTVPTALITTCRRALTTDDEVTWFGDELKRGRPRQRSCRSSG